MLVRCNESGDGFIGPAFDDGSTASYSTKCVGQLTFVVGDQVNLDQYFGKHIVWIVQSDGLINQTQENNDTLIECVTAGTGTLWVAFTSPDTDYYDLTCANHEQGGGN